MSKREADELELSTGESSDDGTVNVPATKKLNASWAPVCLSMQPSRPFQQPNRAGSPSSRLSQVTPSSSRLKAKPTVALLPPHMKLPTPQGTPSLDNDTGGSSDSDSPNAPSTSVSKKADDRTKIVVAPATTNTADPLARSRLAFEKQLNDLSNALEENEKRNEERHDHNKEWHRQNVVYQERTDMKLNQVLGALTALSLQLKERPTEHTPDNPDREPAPMTVAPPAKLVLTNPPVTDALMTIIKSVVKNRAQRAEERKDRGSTAEENSTREQIRQTFYWTIGGIKQLKDIPPPFFNEKGAPDTLPYFAVDPDTGYCQPYPDWTSPSVIRPNGFQLSLSVSGRQFPTTAVTVAKHLAYRKVIPAFQGPEHNWVFHREAMARQVSDDEGNVVINTPQWRASWVRKLFASVDSAELHKAMQKPGLCPRPRPPTFGKGPSRPSQLTKMGPNGREVPVLIAYCGLKKGWRQENHEFIDSSPHIIDKDVKSTPFTSDFTNQYPQIVYKKPSDDELDSVPAEVVGLEGEASDAKGWGEVPFELDGGEAADDEDEEVPVHTDQQDVSQLIDPALWEAPKAPARPRPRMIAPLPASQPETTAVGLTFAISQGTTAPISTAGSLGGNLDDSELDPPPTSAPPPHSGNPSDPDSTGYQLPPPPSLLRQAQAAAELAASQLSVNEPTQPVTKKRAKRQALMSVAGPSSAIGALTGGDPSQGANSLEGEKPLVKKRGRLLGSKNKKKAQE